MKRPKISDEKTEDLGIYQTLFLFEENHYNYSQNVFICLCSENQSEIVRIILTGAMILVIPCPPPVLISLIRLAVGQVCGPLGLPGSPLGVRATDF